MELRNENQTRLEIRKNAVNLPRPHLPSTASLTTTNKVTTGTALKSSSKTTLLQTSHLIPPDEPQAETETPPVHPFANSTSKLELIPSSTTTTADGIDVEEEARLYDELCRNYEEETDDVCPSLSHLRGHS